MKEKIMNILGHLQNKWGLKSFQQVVLICIVFSLAGFSVLFLRKTFFHWVGFDEHTPFWLKSALYLITIFPSFQMLLLIYGFLLGQFSFFYEKD